MPSYLPYVKCKFCYSNFRSDKLERHIEQKHPHQWRLAKEAQLKPEPPKEIILTLWNGDGVRFKEEYEPKHLWHHTSYHLSNGVWLLSPKTQHQYPLIRNKRLFVAGDEIEVCFSVFHLNAKAEHVVRAEMMSEPSKTSLPFNAIFRG
jgi:hypothetical protein